MHKKEIVKVSALYFLITLLFFYKIFFGLLPLPSDMIVGSYFPWLAYEKGTSGLGVPVKNPKLSDAISIFYPLKDLAAKQFKNGETPLWNPHMFGGYPLFTSPTLGLLFPTTILYFLISTPAAWTIQTMSQPFFAALFMYLFLRYIKLKKIPSFYGGIAYGFGGFSILWLQWNGQATTSMFLPLILLFFDKYLKTKKRKWGGALSLTVFCQILSGYLPIISLTYVVVGFWYFFFSKNRIKDLKIFLYIILGFCMSGFFLVPLGELVLLSQRTSETIGDYSPFLLLQNMVHFVAPDFYGNDATYNYWGTGDHMDPTLYAGITSLIFSMLALIKLRSIKTLKFLVYLFILIMIIATANPIGKFVYGLGVWGGGSITMNRANFIFNFILATMSAYGISYYKDKNYKVGVKSAFFALMILVGLGLSVLVIKVNLMENLDFKALFSLSDQPDLTITHLNIALRNMIWPTIIGSVTLISIILIRKTQFQRRFTLIIFVSILIIDLFRLGWKFNTFSKTQYIYPDTNITDFLKKYPNDRFISESDVLPPNMWIPLGLSSISGYDSIYPKRAAQLIAVANSGNVDASPQPRWGAINTTASPILDASNVRFFVALKRDGDAQVRSEGDINTDHEVERFTEVFEDKGVAILENESFLPRSYMTNKVIKRSDRDALTLMIDEDFDISKTSITGDLEIEPENDSEFLFETDYNSLSNSKVVVNTSANMDALLVVLDSYYPGWDVYIDGVESTIHLTNYNFRGVLLEKGNHTVEFIYSPRSLKYGLLLSGFSFLVLIMILKSPHRLSRDKIR